MKLTRPGIQKLAVSVAALLMLLISGCATGSGGTGEEDLPRTLQETEIDISAPMTWFRSANAAGTVTQGDQEKVNNAYARYKAAHREALRAANNNPDAWAPDNVRALAEQVIAAVHAAEW